MIKKSWRALFLREGIKIKRAIVRNFLVQYKLDKKIRDGRNPRDHLIPCCHFIDWETEPRDRWGLGAKSPTALHRAPSFCSPAAVSLGADVAGMARGLALVTQHGKSQSPPGRLPS